MSSLYIDVMVSKFMDLAEITESVSQRNSGFAGQVAVWIGKHESANDRIKVDAYDLIEMVKLPKFEAVKCGVADINWYDHFGYVMYFSSLWQRLVVRNNGLMLKGWLECQIKRNKAFIDHHLGHVAEYVESEVNDPLRLCGEHMDKKYPAHMLVTMSGAVMHDIYTSAYRLYVFMLAKPAIDMNRYLKESGFAVLDDMLKLLK